MYEDVGCLDPEEYDTFNSTTFSILRAINKLTNEKDGSPNIEIITEPKRECKSCGVELTKNSKYQNQCTRCYNKTYAELNKEKLREYHRQKYLANKAQILRDAKAVRETKRTDKCLECGIETKILLNNRCGKCYQQIGDFKLGDDFKYLTNETEEGPTSNIFAPIVKGPKFCQDCGVEITYRTTVNRCKRCNKNHHRRASRKRVRERSRKVCSICGVLFKISTLDQSELKCTSCIKKEGEDKLLENFTENGVNLLNYLSNITSTSLNTKPKRIQTYKPRGNCEECGAILPTRGYLMKCKPCNKRAYKKMMRQRKRETNRENATDEQAKEKFTLISKVIKQKPQEIRYCTNCPNVLHSLCRGELCRRCNKNKYKREARRRKREKRLTESTLESVETVEEYQMIQSSNDCLNQMVDQIEEV